MRLVPIFAFSAILLLSVAAHAGSRKVIDPLDPAIVAQHQVAEVEIIVTDTAKPNFEKLEALAAGKRSAAGLPVAVPTLPADAARPARDIYATLPFSQMFPLVMQDVTREWGLTSGVPVKLKVTLDTVKMANAGMAMLLGSADQMAGLVEVIEPVSGKMLGSFYIDVINSHGGLGGLALRGSGVRESLSEEFALESSRVLTGRKSKTPKKKSS